MKLNSACENWGFGSSKCRNCSVLMNSSLLLPPTSSRSIPLKIWSTRLHSTLTATISSLYGKNHSSRVTVYSVYQRMFGEPGETYENFSQRTKSERVVLGVKSKEFDLVPVRTHWKFCKCLQDYTNSCPKYINLGSKLHRTPQFIYKIHRYSAQTSTGLHEFLFEVHQSSQ
jgi:hypothetical protein